MTNTLRTLGKGLGALVAAASISGCAANIGHIPASEHTSVSRRILPEEVEETGSVRVRYHPNGFVILMTGKEDVAFAYNASSGSCILVEGDRSDYRLKIEDDACNLVADSIKNKSIEMTSFTKEAETRLNDLLKKRRSDVNFLKVYTTWEERWR